MTKKIFSVFLLCLFLYACAGSQTNPNDVQSTTPDKAKSVSSAAVNNQEQSNKEKTTGFNKNEQLSATVIQYLYMIKDAKMRKSASNTSKVMVTLKKGEMVEKIDSSKYWVKVKTASGKTGWVSNKLVSENQ